MTSRTTATLAPVAAVLAIGVPVIAFEGFSGRAGAHAFWMSIVLLESTAALLFRRRHPMGALAAILTGYLAFDFLGTVAAPMFVALFTVAMTSEPRRAAAVTGCALAVVLGTPLLHGDSSTAPLTIFAALALLAVAVLAQAVRMRSAPAPVGSSAARRTAPGIPS
jgi:hypothetical protein